MIVTMDYFIKWVEEEPLKTITTRDIIKFLWKALESQTIDNNSILATSKTVALS